MKNKLALFFFIYHISLSAQREGDCLVVGYCDYALSVGCNPPYGSAIYKFNEEGIEYIDENAGLNLSTSYSRAAFSDRHTGELIFASNGWRLVNRSGQVLAHKLYNDEIPHPGGTADTTNINNFLGPIFLNDPGDSTKAYLFYGQTQRKNYPGIGQAALDVLFTYAYLDIPTQSLISKGNVVVDEPTAPYGGMAACRHANGRDWWLVKLGAYLDDFYIGLLSPQGVDLQKITYHVKKDSLSGRTWTYFNQNGTKMIRFASSYRELHVFDFDRCSGVLSNLIVHDLRDSLGTGDWNACNISPDGTKFYVRRSPSRGGGTLQYDIETSEYTYITEISSAPQLTPNYKHILLGSRILTENDSIYQTISTIYEPNQPGLQCNFVLNSDTVKNIPKFISPSCFANFRLGPLNGSPCDTIVSGINEVKEGSLKVYPNPSNGMLNVQLPGVGQAYQVRLLNSMGQQIFTTHTNENLFSIDISSLKLSSGILLVEASDEKKQQVYRMKVIYLNN
jgi:hypothetical protein